MNPDWRWSRLPRAVWLLGFVSLLTDTASEAIYPLLPFFLTTTLGARPLSLGVVEGVAEATASLFRIGAGRWSDRQGLRRRWVVWGYSLSSLIRPMMSVAGSWGQVLALRFTDRIGKGVRGAPRDAWLAILAPPHARGRVFGLHRAMDHVGAILGPVAAALLLWAKPGAYRELFAWTLLPGLAVIALLFRLPRDPGPAPVPIDGLERGTRAEPKPRLPSPFYRVLAVFALFALGNSTDAYLLLRLGNATKAPAIVPLLWAALHVVKAGTSVLGGVVADRGGRRLAISAGWTVYAGVYLVFASSSEPLVLVTAFLAYGAYFGFAEAAEKALVADWAPAAVRGTAFGLYHAVSGLGALAASVLFGLLWETMGPPVAFGAGAALSAAATVLLWQIAPPGSRTDVNAGERPPGAPCYT